MCRSVHPRPPWTPLDTVHLSTQAGPTMGWVDRRADPSSMNFMTKGHSIHRQRCGRRRGKSLKTVGNTMSLDSKQMEVRDNWWRTTQGKWLQSSWQDCEENWGNWLSGKNCRSCQERIGTPFFPNAPPPLLQALPFYDPLKKFSKIKVLGQSHIIGWLEQSKGIWLRWKNCRTCFEMHLRNLASYNPVKMGPRAEMGLT